MTEPVSAVQRPRAGASPLITWTGQPTAPSIHLAEDRFAPRLHFVLVDHIAGLGFVVAGWFADPLSAVKAISLGSGTDQHVDLLSEAIRVTDRHHNQGFNLPAGIAVGFAFVLLVPDRLSDGAKQLYLRLRLVTGDRCDQTVPIVGDFIDLADVLADAPLDYALRIVERQLTAWRSGNGRSRRLPDRVEAFARLVHSRIDQARDYGAQSARANASCHVDGAIRVGTTGMLVTGWLIHDDADRTKDIALVSLTGQRVVLDTPLPAKSRLDVLASDIGALAPVDCGYAAFATIDNLDPLDAHWFLEVVTTGGTIRRVPFTCPPAPSALDGIAAAVTLAEENDANPADLFERAIAPAVEWFWAQTRLPELTSTATVYGSPPSDAQVSVVVPLYGRLDFVRHQIARFSNDPEFRSETGTIDLIYVLDDPTKADEFNRLCRILHDIYDVPFRTLVQSRNRGYSAANNAGAAVALGRLLLLLNSDVFPTGPRWIGRLAAAYDTLDRCGILGCRLLFEDGSIQHAGMTFRESRTLRGCWENEHPGRGLSVAFDTHTTAEPVPAVTGACLMIGRALFDKVGGLSEAYVIADFEDSDLCLQVQQEGFKVYYTPEVELYHLERQSVRLVGHGNKWWRQSLTLYNMWKHSRRWGEMIPKVLEGVAACCASSAAPDAAGDNKVLVFAGVDRTHARY